MSLGLTHQLDEATSEDGRRRFFDTPGLADEKLRKAAGQDISEALRKGGDYIVLFFATNLFHLSEASQGL